MPSSDCSKPTVKFVKLNTKFPEVVTRKVWFRPPSSDPCTWQPITEHRLTTEVTPPVVRTMKRVCAVAAEGPASANNRNATRAMNLGFMLWSFWGRFPWYDYVPSGMTGGLNYYPVPRQTATLNLAWRKFFGAGTQVPPERAKVSAHNAALIRGYRNPPSA